MEMLRVRKKYTSENETCLSYFTFFAREKKRQEKKEKFEEKEKTNYFF